MVSSIKFPLKLLNFSYKEPKLSSSLIFRPHNSGHLSIETCKTSQFQQHIRSVFNLKLGNTEHDGHAIMLNLVGDENYSAEYPFSTLTKFVYPFLSKIEHAITLLYPPAQNNCSFLSLG